MVWTTKASCIVMFGPTTDNGQVCVHVYICMYTGAYSYVYYVYVTYEHLYTDAYILYIHVYMCAYIYVYIHLCTRGTIRMRFDYFVVVHRTSVLNIGPVLRMAVDTSVPIRCKSNERL